MIELLFKYPWRLFREGTVVFNGQYALEIRLALAAVLIAAAWLLYRRLPARVASRRRVTLLALRALVVALLVLLILPPLLRTPDLATRDRFTVFLLDDTRSMTLKDADGGRTRLAAEKLLLTGQESPADFSHPAGGLAAEAAELGGVTVLRFSDVVDLAGRPEDLKGDHDGTDLSVALKNVEERMRSVPLAAVIMISDGQHTEQTDPAAAAQLMAARGVPIFTVGLGQSNPPPDREISAVSAPPMVRRPATVDVTVTVGTHGYNKPYVVRLREGDTPAGEVKVEPQGDPEVRQVKIPLNLTRTGIFTYTVEVPPEPGESVVANNVRQFRMEVQERRLPVLYVEGSPRTEFRFIRGALFRDKDFRIISLLRTGKDDNGKDRFLIQGAEGDAEQFKDLLEGFPKTKERLNEFEAVILGDLEAAELTADQHAMLEEFVSTRGGGLLMLGGVNSFNLGGYEGTPVGKMLPVDLQPKSVGYDPREFRVRVAEKGVTHPVMFQAADAMTNSTIWNSVSPLIGRNPVKKIKPGATSLLEAVDTGEPVLAVQNYGKGRTAAFTTGGSWFWRMDREIGDKLHERFWRQLVRWLSVGAEAQLTVATDKDSYLPKEAVVLTTTVLGKNLEPVNDATVTAVIETPFGTQQEVRLEWILSQDGVYQGQYIAHDPGEYKVTYKITTPDKTTETHSRFGVREAYTEFTRSWQNAPLLKQLAERTDGRYYDEKSAAGMFDEIRKRLTASASVQGQVRTYSLWDMPVLLAALVGIMLTEWLLRRRAGLP